MYICIYTHAYRHLHIYYTYISHEQMHTCMYICIHACMSLCLCLHMLVDAHVHIHMRTHVHLHIHTYIQTYTNTYIYIYVYIHMYIYIYAPTSWSRPETTPSCRPGKNVECRFCGSGPWEAAEGQWKKSVGLLVCLLIGIWYIVGIRIPDQGPI